MEFSILSKDADDNRYMLVECKYGVCRVKKQHFDKGHIPTIMSALDKTEFFWNKVKENNSYVYSNFTLKSKYISDLKKVIIESKGIHFKMTPRKILSNFKPGFKSCMNKTKYFINLSQNIHEDKYDYSLVEYINAKTKVKIICKEHGIFEQSPTNHLNNKGCLECGRISTKNHVINNNRSSLSLKHWRKSNGVPKIYLLRCWNDTEEFYKIGKTHQNIKSRFDSNKLMPYNYEVLDLLKSDADTISNVEACFKSVCNYTPNIKFPGYSECFLKLPSNVKINFKEIFCLIKNFTIEDIVLKKIDSKIIGDYEVEKQNDFFIVKLNRFNLFIKVVFYKNSYSKYDFYEGYGRKVSPKQKTITVFD